MREPNKNPDDSVFQQVFSIFVTITILYHLYRQMPTLLELKEFLRLSLQLLTNLMTYIKQYPQILAQIEEENRLAAAVHADEDANNVLNLDEGRLEQEHEQLGAILYLLLEAHRQNDNPAQPFHAAPGPSNEVDGGLPEPQPAYANQGELLANVGLLCARRNNLPVIEQDHPDRGCDKSPPSHR